MTKKIMIILMFLFVSQFSQAQGSMKIAENGSLVNEMTDAEKQESLQNGEEEEKETEKVQKQKMEESPAEEMAPEKSIESSGAAPEVPVEE